MQRFRVSGGVLAHFSSDKSSSLCAKDIKASLVGFVPNEPNPTALGSEAPKTMQMLNFIISSFYDLWYRFFPPESVKYWKRGEGAKAKVIKKEDGSYGLKIENEDRIYPGFPRGHVLTGPLAKLKHSVKNMVFNQVFAEMEKMTKDFGADMKPAEHMAPAVRHMWETFEKLEECEVVPDMKARIRLIKKVICFFLEEDDAYRFRAQLFLDLIDQKKVRLSRDDKYYLRAKYFRTDRFKKIFGKTFDAYTY